MLALSKQPAPAAARFTKSYGGSGNVAESQTQPASPSAPTTQKPGAAEEGGGQKNPIHLQKNPTHWIAASVLSLHHYRGQLFFFSFLKPQLFGTTEVSR